MEVKASKQRLVGSRFIKYYKYKHKHKHRHRRRGKINFNPNPNPNTSLKVEKTASSCDRMAKVSSCRRIATCRSLVIFTITLQLLNKAAAFCPSKCLCDDLALTANCTRLPSVTTIPTTLNPLLKRLTLNHLPLAELATSLSVYRQLEHLNLQSNQLRQINYENLNFKQAPPSVSLSTSVHLHPQLVAQNDYAAAKHHHSTLNSHQEQLARHLKQAIDKSMSSAGLPADEAAEIRFHLRRLDLSDNRIEKLGDLDLDLIHEEDEREESATITRIRARDLERLAPFLTLTKLEQLNLSGNKLRKLHRHVFLGLLSLQELDLSKNQLEWLHKYALVGLIELKQLKLNHNHLTTLGALSLTFCRAPLNELRQLDLSNQSNSMNYDYTQMLPNQMFICTPKLRQLRLEWVQLRHIQVNAFDNLQELESLHLNGNKLEHVPSDSLAHSNSRLSNTLRHLDLSETLIEFVSAGSLAALTQLERLSMNSMGRLVSFDLASLSLVPENLLHLVAAPAGAQMEQTELQGQFPVLANGRKQSLNSDASTSIINHGRDDYWAEEEEEDLDSQTSAESQLSSEHQIHSRLRELELRNNLRLQSLRCSTSGVIGHAGNRKCKLNQLWRLDLAGSVELRELPLEKLLDLPTSQQLYLDLSFVNRLNCSSCRLNWLFEALRGHSSKILKISLIGAPESIGCAWPLQLPLVQLLELDSNLAPLLSHCRRLSGKSARKQQEIKSGAQESPQRLPPPPATDGSFSPAQSSDTNQSFASSLVLAIVLLLLAVTVGARLALVLLAKRQQRQLDEGSSSNAGAFQWAGGFKWRPVGAAAAASDSPSASSPASSQHNSASSSSSSSSAVAAARAHQHQLFHHSAVVSQPPANLFSRLVGLFRPGRSRAVEHSSSVLGQVQGHHRGLIGIGSGRHWAEKQQTSRWPAGLIVNQQQQHRDRGDYLGTRPQIPKLPIQVEQHRQRMSPAAGQLPLNSLASAQGEHIYVTLDRPISATYASCGPPALARPQPPSSVEQRYGLTKDYKSFEWTTTGQFKLAKPKDDHGRQLAEQLGKLSLQIEAADRPTFGSECCQMQNGASSVKELASGLFHRGNVTGHSDYSDEVAKGGSKNGAELNGPSSGGLAATAAANPMKADPLLSIAPFASAEYDANHAAAAAAAANNDDDRVINGLPGQRQQQQHLPAAPSSAEDNVEATMGVAVLRAPRLPSHDSHEEANFGGPTGGQRPHNSNMIGQQQQQHRQPERVCDYLTGQQRFCDIPAANRRPPRLVGAPAVISGAQRACPNGPVTNGHEIYSNQFYYCRPSGGSNPDDK